MSEVTAASTPVALADRPAPARPKRSGQRKVRKYALDLLFAADLRQVPVSQVLATYAELNQAPPPARAVDLAEGVAAQIDAIDACLTPALAPGWSVERMPSIDRNLARLACYEMLYHAIAPGVAISEAVGLAEELSTEASAGFLSGLLHRVAQQSEPDEAREADMWEDEAGEDEGGHDAG